MKPRTEKNRSSLEMSPRDQKIVAVGRELDESRIVDGAALVKKEEERLGRKLTLMESMEVVRPLYL